jgi:hypothetical protein
MARWLEHISHATLLDQATDLINLHRSPGFATVVATYALIDYDVLAFCSELERLVAVGRDELARQEAAGSVHELESEESRDVIPKAKHWVDLLHAAGKLAKTKKHPFAKRMRKLFFMGETSIVSWRDAVTTLSRIIVNLTNEPVNFKEIRLPLDFLEQGKAIRTSLFSERAQAIGAAGALTDHTERLAEVMSEIVDKFEEIIAARDLAMLSTGKDIPGLELSLARAAAAGPGDRSGMDAGDPAPGTLPGGVSAGVLPAAAASVSSGTPATGL